MKGKLKFLSLRFLQTEGHESTKTNFRIQESILVLVQNFQNEVCNRKIDCYREVR